MSDVFISYARSTAPQAKLVAEALRSLGYAVWLDDDLPAHRTYSYWRSSGHWPDYCSEAGWPYNCKAVAANLE